MTTVTGQEEGPRCQDTKGTSGSFEWKLDFTLFWTFVKRYSSTDYPESLPVRGESTLLYGLMTFLEKFSLST